MVKELKKELSKLSGVDFFNPKYRDVFKKYFPNDTTESDVNDNEEDRLKEVLGEETEETPKAVETQENAEGNKEENTSEDNDETSTDENKEEDKSDNSDEEPSKDNGDDADTQDATDTEPNADDNDSTDTTDSSQGTETTAEDDNQDTSSTETTDTLPTTEDNAGVDNTSKELLETKVELQLVKANVREDRLESAKKLFMQEIHSLEDLDKLKDLIKQYPEWLKQNKPEVKPFGMPLEDNGDGLTEEEKRLKAMGIDPKS